MEEIIRVEDLSKFYRLYAKPIDRLKEALSIKKNTHYQEFSALENVSFTLKKGQCMGVIGKNGSGKSTLLKILTGVLTPTTGSVNINGRISALLELGAGFNTEYTGIENIYVNGTMLGYSKNEIDKKLEAILDFADIGDFVYQPIKLYSSGMFVRLAFAVAINVDPEILIIDEALSVGDMYFQNKCYRKFDEFKKSGKTILLVTHDMGSVLKYCDEAILLSKGKLLKSGAPKEVVDEYKKTIVKMGEKNNSIKSIYNKGIYEETNWKNFYKLNPTCLEYGSQKAKIVDFGIFDITDNLTNVVKTGEIYTFKFIVEFTEKIDGPIFAFSIKDIKGTELTGTNTLFENLLTGNYDKGDRAVVTFEQNLWLMGGPFLLSLGCTKFLAGGDLEVFHRLYDIIGFETTHQKDGTGYFSLNSTVDVKILG